MGSGNRNSLSICALRFTRCTSASNGAPISSNPHGAVSLVGGVGSVKWTSDIVAGDKVRELDGCGNLAVVKRYRDRLAGMDVELDFLVRSHEMREISYGATLLLDDDSEIVGHADVVDTACGAATSSAGVIVEAWGENWKCAAGDPLFPYERVVFARFFAVPGDGTMQRGTNHLVLKGYAEPNPSFGNGPFNDLDPALDVDDWIRLSFDDTALPAASVDGGYLATPAQT